MDGYLISAIDKEEKEASAADTNKDDDCFGSLLPELQECQRWLYILSRVILWDI